MSFITNSIFVIVIVSGFIFTCVLSVNLSSERNSRSGKRVKVLLSGEEESAEILSSESGPSGKVRIVTDLVFFDLGIHIDFRYNQTKKVEDSIVSAPGCPKTTAGRPWVYYGAPRKCVLVGFRGPCPFGQRIFQLEHSNFGVCNCDCFAVKQIVPENLSEMPALSNYNLKDNLILYPREERRGRRIATKLADYFAPQKRCNRTKAGAFIVNSKYMKSVLESDFVAADTEPLMDEEPAKSRYQFCFSEAHHRQVVYDSGSQTCYPFLDQGPCQMGEWLVKNLEDDSVLCEKRKCNEFVGHSDKDHHHGGGFTYFDYKRQECIHETFGSHKESFFHTSGTIVRSRNSFCREAGMKYSSIRKTCVTDHKIKIDFNVLG
ncbi:unnamed protein product [Orchesella dallaii]|uniref:DUF4789 domain-containing protein n=1 Tax=Orchesella dallaii TaxID=48710 RepID=A0ABP1S6X7_9HEXA